MLRQYQFAFARHFSRLNWQVPLAIGLTITLWASAFAGIRAGSQSYSSQSVVLLRYLTASIALAAYVSVTKMPLPQRRDLPGIVLAGFIDFTLYSVTLNAGEQKIPAGTTSLIIASAPIYGVMNCHTIM